MNSQKGAAPILILVAIIGVVSFLAVSSSAPFTNNLLTSIFPKEQSQAATFNPSTRVFLETFDGNPASPEAFAPDDWDLKLGMNFIRESGGNPEPMMADHGPDCGAPPATHQSGGDAAKAVFICRGHLMTALNGGGYGALFLTPPAIVDFSAGEAVIKLNMSTLRTSARDWVDFWIVPYDEAMALPFEGNGFWIGQPKRGVQVRMGDIGGAGNTGFTVVVYDNFVPISRDQFGRNFYLTNDAGYNNFLTPSAKRRDPFEIRISRTHIKMGIKAMPCDTASPPNCGGPTQDFLWVDQAIPDLGWGNGVFTIGHHSYNPLKDESFPPPIKPGTWHFDNLSIAPAIPFTIIQNPRVRHHTTGTSPVSVTFNKPAPANAHLRFVATNLTNVNPFQVSFNNGSSWQTAQRQVSSSDDNQGLRSYWTPIPQGTSNVLFRHPNGGEWWVWDPAIWSLSQQAASSPAPSLAPSLSPQPSSTPVPSAKPGDIDSNGKVDIFDFNTLLTNFGQTGSNNPADLDKNGKVDIFDFNILLTNFGK